MNRAAIAPGFSSLWLCLCLYHTSQMMKRATIAPGFFCLFFFFFSLPLSPSLSLPPSLPPSLKFFIGSYKDFARTL